MAVESYEKHIWLIINKKQLQTWDTKLDTSNFKTYYTLKIVMFLSTCSLNEGRLKREFLV